LSALTGTPQFCINTRKANVFFQLQTRSALPTISLAASRSARTYASDAKAAPTEVSSILEQRIRGVSEESSLAETGRVLSVGYEIYPRANNRIE